MLGTYQWMLLSRRIKPTKHKRRMLENDYGGFQVDRLTHSLQTATRAYRDGRDDEYVVCALLHDMGGVQLL